MSKEKQLTALDFLKTKGVDPDLVYSDYIKYLEQYAQAKVLAALEREVIKAYDVATQRSLMHHVYTPIKEDSIIYYETEVKPKYK
jgi:hypothetical protein